MNFNELLQLIAKIVTFEVSLGDSKVSVGAILFVTILFLGFIVLSRIIRTFLLRALVPKLKLDKSAEFTLLKVTHYTVIGLGFLVSLSTLGVNITSLAFVAGLLSVGIGFGLQNIVQNFVAGLILLFEQPIKVGDWVKVGDQEGEVKEINLRSTGIETGDSIYIIVPNQDFISSPVINGSKGDAGVSMATEITVTHDADMKLVADLLLSAAQEHADVLKAPPPKVFMASFDGAGVRFRLGTSVLQPSSRGRVRMELTERIWWKLKEAGIPIPTSHKDVHIRSVGEGPLQVRMME